MVLVFIDSLGIYEYEPVYTECRQPILKYKEYYINSHTQPVVAGQVQMINL
jgi:hypothetical protein